MTHMDREQLIGIAGVMAVGVVMLAAVYFEGRLCHPGASFLCDLARGFVSIVAPRIP